MATIRLGDLLVKAKVVSESQLKAALAEQQKWGGKLGELLVRMNFLTEDMLVKALSKQLNIPAVNLEAVDAVPAHVRAKLPTDVARDLNVLPLQLRDDGRTLVVAMAEPQNLKQLDTLRSVTRCRITPQIAGRQSIARAFSRLYQGDNELSESDEGFKFVDAQGHTLIKSIDEVKAADAARRASQSPAQNIKMPPVRAPTSEVPPPVTSKTPAETLRAIEEAQRKEVTALKGMVELLIEKGVFTREEYLAKVKR